MHYKHTKIYNTIQIYNMIQMHKYTMQYKYTNIQFNINIQIYNIKEIYENMQCNMDPFELHCIVSCCIVSQYKYLLSFVVCCIMLFHCIVSCCIVSQYEYLVSLVLCCIVLLHCIVVLFHCAVTQRDRGDTLSGAGKKSSVKTHLFNFLS